MSDPFGNNVKASFSFLLSTFGVGLKSAVFAVAVVSMVPKDSSNGIPTAVDYIKKKKKKKKGQGEKGFFFFLLLCYVVLFFYDIFN